MDNFDFAYYLSPQQLLLLLSLIDRRPVAGLPPVEEKEDWQKVSMSLIEDGRLRCEGGQLVMDAGLSELLLTMKGAECVYMLYGNGQEPDVLALYPGMRPALMEFLPDGKNRLRGVAAAEIGQLVLSRLVPDYPVPEALLTSLPEDAILRECLRRWEAKDISLRDPPSLWLQVPEVRGVLERWTPEARVRWIWIEDKAAGLILCQDLDGARAALDTASQRRSLLRKLGLET